MHELLGIAGSGAIATGLGRLAGGLGDAVLYARSDESAERARAKLDGACEVVTDLGAFADRTLVVECVKEDPEIKGALLAELSGIISPDALLASTTSSLSVAELAAASGRPDKFAALHVFNPVEKMKLVELSFPDAAVPETHRRFRELCEALGKTTVEVPDAPGFVVNRLLFPYLFDAVEFMAESGLEPEAVDTCMKLGAGHPMGPLALLDFVGLDVSAAIAEEIGVEVPAQVTELIAAGKLGRKSGAGFFDYSR
jgi:3-hydroxybutyryl-CoA dehydrogenase